MDFLVQLDIEYSGMINIKVRRPLGTTADSVELTDIETESAIEQYLTSRVAACDWDTDHAHVAKFRPADDCDLDVDLSDHFEEE